jgi:UDP-N-acetylglucosamine diphosphorylase / glucose-1-phosphate thymidylyltransferase / UDP-N-acetylgalactosamine diphosphorylase / glucosamine-1-phosphate N-acetyltransferase / galactosamine-1-phosphate N-acetyltransferase
MHQEKTSVIEQAVILAAGQGSRLGKLTKDRPKSMLPVLGKPMVVRIMDRLREAGIHRFVVVVGEHEGAVAAYLSSSWYPNMDLKFSLQTVPTGTVDALLLATPYIDGPFLLTAVDNLTSPEHIENLISRFNAADDTIATLSLLSATPDEIRRSSGVRIEGERITAIEEKPADPQGAWASIMLYAFDKRFLEYLPQVRTSPRGEREIVSAIQASIDDGHLVTYAQTDWRLHLSTELDLLAINRHFLQEGRDTHILSELPGSVHITPPVRIDPQVSVGQSAHIGPDVYLESGTTVGQGAALENTVVLSGTTISARARSFGQIIAPDVCLSEPQEA